MPSYHCGLVATEFSESVRPKHGEANKYWPQYQHTCREYGLAFDRHNISTVSKSGCEAKENPLPTLSWVVSADKNLR
jgi:hypothetical protein